MRDQELVNALREHADWWENGDMMDPLGGLEKDLFAAADRLENQNAHIAALQQEIEKLRGQVPRWIPVEERLPEVWCNDETAELGYSAAGYSGNGYSMARKELLHCGYGIQGKQSATDAYETPPHDGRRADRRQWNEKRKGANR